MHCRHSEEYRRHDDVIKWKHFLHSWRFAREIHRSPVDSPPSQRTVTGALILSLICAWTNGWENNRDVGDFGRHHAHYNVTVMNPILPTEVHCKQHHGNNTSCLSQWHMPLYETNDEPDGLTLWYLNVGFNPEHIVNTTVIIQEVSSRVPRV